MSGITIPLSTDSRSAQVDLINLNKSLASLVLNSNKANKALGQISVNTGLKNSNTVLTKNLKLLKDTKAQGVDTFESVGKSAGNTSSTISRMMNPIIAVTAAFMAIKAVSAFNSMADDLTNIQNRLKIIISDQDEMLLRQKQIYRMSKDTRSEFKDSADLFVGFSQALNAKGVNFSRVINVIKTIQQASAMSGGTQQATAAGLQQLTQGISSGVFGGDELRSVLENLQYLNVGLQRQLKMSSKQIRDFGASGKFSAEMLLNALEGMAERTNKDFQKTTATVGQAFSLLGQSISNAFGQINKSFGIADNFSKKLISISNSIDTFLDEFFTQTVLLRLRVVNFIDSLNDLNPFEMTLKAIIRLEISPFEAVDKYQSLTMIKDYLAKFKDTFSKVQSSIVSVKLKFGSSIQAFIPFQSALQTTIELLKAFGGAFKASFNNLAYLVPIAIGPMKTISIGFRQAFKGMIVDADAFLYRLFIPFGRSLENINQRLNLFSSGDARIERAWVRMFNSKSVREFVDNLNILNIVRQKIALNDKTFVGRQIVRSLREMTFGIQNFLIYTGLMENQLIRIRETRLDRFVRHFEKSGQVIGRVYKDVFAPRLEPAIFKVIFAGQALVETFLDAMHDTFSVNRGREMAASFFRGISSLALKPYKLFDFITTGKQGKFANAIFDDDVFIRTKAKFIRFLGDLKVFVKAFLIELKDQILAIDYSTIIGFIKRIALEIYDYLLQATKNFIEIVKVKISTIDFASIFQSVKTEVVKLFGELYKITEDFVRNIGKKISTIDFKGMFRKGIDTTKEKFHDKKESSLGFMAKVMTPFGYDNLETRKQSDTRHARLKKDFNVFQPGEKFSIDDLKESGFDPKLIRTIKLTAQEQIVKRFGTLNLNLNSLAAKDLKDFEKILHQYESKLNKMIGISKGSWKKDASVYNSAYIKLPPFLNRIQVPGLTDNKFSNKNLAYGVNLHEYGHALNFGKKVKWGNIGQFSKEVQNPLSRPEFEHFATDIGQEINVLSTNIWDEIKYAQSTYNKSYKNHFKPTKKNAKEIEEAMHKVLGRVDISSRYSVESKNGIWTDPKIPTMTKIIGPIKNLIDRIILIFQKLKGKFNETFNEIFEIEPIALKAKFSDSINNLSNFDVGKFSKKLGLKLAEGLMIATLFATGGWQGKVVAILYNFSGVLAKPLTNFLGKFGGSIFGTIGRMVGDLAAQVAKGAIAATEDVLANLPNFTKGFLTAALPSSFVDTIGPLIGHFSILNNKILQATILAGGLYAIFAKKGGSNILGFLIGSVNKQTKKRDITGSVLDYGASLFGVSNLLKPNPKPMVKSFPLAIAGIAAIGSIKSEAISAFEGLSVGLPLLAWAILGKDGGGKLIRTVAKALSTIFMMVNTAYSLVTGNIIGAIATNAMSKGKAVGKIGNLVSLALTGHTLMKAYNAKSQGGLIQEPTSMGTNNALYKAALLVKNDFRQILQNLVANGTAYGLGQMSFKQAAIKTPKDLKPPKTSLGSGFLPADQNVVKLGTHLDAFIAEFEATKLGAQLKIKTLFNFLRNFYFANIKTFKADFAKNFGDMFKGGPVKTAAEGINFTTMSLGERIRQFTKVLITDIGKMLVGAFNLPSKGISDLGKTLGKAFGDIGFAKYAIVGISALILLFSGASKASGELGAANERTGSSFGGIIRMAATAALAITGIAVAMKAVSSYKAATKMYDFWNPTIGTTKQRVGTGLFAISKTFGFDTKFTKISNVTSELYSTLATSISSYFAKVSTSIGSVFPSIITKYKGLFKTLGYIGAGAFAINMIFHTRVPSIANSGAAMKTIGSNFVGILKTVGLLTIALVGLGLAMKLLNTYKVTKQIFLDKNMGPYLATYKELAKSKVAADIAMYATAHPKPLIPGGLVGDERKSAKGIYRKWKDDQRAFAAAREAALAETIATREAEFTTKASAAGKMAVKQRIGNFGSDVKQAFTRNWLNLKNVFNPKDIIAKSGSWDSFYKKPAKLGILDHPLIGDIAAKQLRSSIAAFKDAFGDMAKNPDKGFFSLFFLGIGQGIKGLIGAFSNMYVAFLERVGAMTNIAKVFRLTINLLLTGIGAGLKLAWTVAVLPLLKFVAIPALIATGVGVLSTYFFGPKKGFFNNLEWVYDKVRSILGLKAVTEIGRKEDILSSFKETNIGKTKVDFSKQIDRVDWKKVTPNQFSSIGDIASELKDSITGFQKEYLKQGKLSLDSETELSKDIKGVKNAINNLPSKPELIPKEDYKRYAMELQTPDNSRMAKWRRLIGYHPEEENTENKLTGFAKVREPIAEKGNLIDRTILKFVGAVKDDIIDYSSAAVIEILSLGNMKRAVKFPTSYAKMKEANPDAWGLNIWIQTMFNETAKGFNESIYKAIDWALAGEYLYKTPGAMTEAGWGQRVFGKANEFFSYLNLEDQNRYDDFREAYQIASLKYFANPTPEGKVKLEKMKITAEWIGRYYGNLGEHKKKVSDLDAETAKLVGDAKTLLELDLGAEYANFVAPTKAIQYLKDLTEHINDVVTAYKDADTADARYQLRLEKAKGAKIGKNLADKFSSDLWYNTKFEKQSQLANGGVSVEYITRLKTSSGQLYNNFDKSVTAVENLKATISELQPDKIGDSDLYDKFVAQLKKAERAVIENSPGTLLIEDINSKLGQVDVTALTKAQAMLFNQDKLKEYSDKIEELRLKMFEYKNLTNTTDANQLFKEQKQYMEDILKLQKELELAVKMATIGDVARVMDDKSMSSTGKANIIAKDFGVEIPSEVTESTAKKGTWSKLMLKKNQYLAFMDKLKLKFNDNVPDIIANWIGKKINSLDKQLEAVSEKSKTLMEVLQGLGGGFEIGDIRFLGKTAFDRLKLLGLQSIETDKQLNLMNSDTSKLDFDSKLSEKANIAKEAFQILLALIHSTPEKIDQALSSFSLPEIRLIPDIALDALLQADSIIQRIKRAMQDEKNVKFFREMKDQMEKTKAFANDIVSLLSGSSKLLETVNAVGRTSISKEVWNTLSADKRAKMGLEALRMQKADLAKENMPLFNEMANILGLKVEDRKIIVDFGLPEEDKALLNNFKQVSYTPEGKSSKEIAAQLAPKVLQYESARKVNALSPVGAFGLMQLMPNTAKGLGVNSKIPQENFAGGVKYLEQMLTKFGNNIPVALEAYNKGPYSHHLTPGSYSQGVLSEGHGKAPDWNDLVTLLAKSGPITNPEAVAILTSIRDNTGKLNYSFQMPKVKTVAPKEFIVPKETSYEDQLKTGKQNLIDTRKATLDTNLIDNKYLKSFDDLVNSIIEMDPSLGNLKDNFDNLDMSVIKAQADLATRFKDVNLQRDLGLNPAQAKIEKANLKAKSRELLPLAAQLKAEMEDAQLQVDDAIFNMLNEAQQEAVRKIVEETNRLKLKLKTDLTSKDKREDQTLLNAEKKKFDKLTEVKPTPAELAEEAGKAFSSEVGNGFKEGLKGLLEKKQTFKEFAKTQMENFSTSVINTFVDGLMQPLTGEGGIVFDLAKKMGQSIWGTGDILTSTATGQEGITLEDLAKGISPDILDKVANSNDSVSTKLTAVNTTTANTILTEILAAIIGSNGGIANNENLTPGSMSSIARDAGFGRDSSYLTPFASSINRFAMNGTRDTFNPGTAISDILPNQAQGSSYLSSFNLGSNTGGFWGDTTSGINLTDSGMGASAGSGLASDAFTPLFQSIDTGVTSSSGNFSNMFSGVDSGISGLGSSFSSMFSGIGSLIGGAAGGKSGSSTGAAVGNAVGSIVGILARLADGGPVYGKGTGTSDSILAMVSNGEYVVNAKQTRQHFALLHAINSDSMPKLASGGLVSDSIISTPNFSSIQAATTTKSQITSGNQVINLSIVGDISRQTKSEIYKMLPSIAAGVNTHNKEQNYNYAKNR